MRPRRSSVGAYPSLREQTCSPRTPTFAMLFAVSVGTNQLSRGRHRLTREQVLTSQRLRMLAAVADAVAEKGFARASVADVIKRAGVSRETFYEQFSDKEDCFLAALEAGAETMLEVIAEATAAPASDPIERLDNVLGAYLEKLAAEPAFAKAYLIDAYGAGPVATGRRIELQQRFVEVFYSILRGAPGSEDRFACEALVAAISSMATARVGSGRAHELPGLRRPIIELVGRMFPALARPLARPVARPRAAR
jgi:AcrR family transcriptional regulator